jgi:hypothetical protein
VGRCGGGGGGGGGGVAVRLETQGSGRGFGPKARNRPTRARFGARRRKQRWWAMGGDGGAVWTRLRRWWGRALGYASRGCGFWAKNPKPAHRGSVEGMPLETAVEGGGERWWGGVDEVVVVVCMCIRARARGRGLGPKNSKSEP